MKSQILLRKLTVGAVISVLSASFLEAAGSAATAQADDVARQVGGWRSDLDFFAAELPRRHANAFHHISRSTFDAKVARLRQRLPTINSDQFWVGLDQIESSIGDGHTFMRMPPSAPRFGLEFKKFNGEYRVVAVAPSVKGDGILGARLVAVDGMLLPKLQAQILTLTPEDELQSLRDFRSQALLTNGLVLHGLGISSNREVVTYRVKDDAGRQKDITLHAVSLEPRAKWTLVQKQAASQTGDQRLQCGPVGEGTTVLCAFRSYDDLEQTSATLFDAVRHNKAQRLIVDMRENNGGNFCTGLKYLVRPISAESSLNRPGGLYILIGQQTFSAAMSNAAHFRQLTNATLVGQPIGEKPNSYQEIEDLRLPFTGWDARYSSRFYHFADGPDNVIRPDVVTPLIWNDYRQGRDRALEYVLSQPLHLAIARHISNAPSGRLVGDEYCGSQ